MTPSRHPSYLFGLHRPHTGSEGAILRAPAGRVRARSGAGHRALGEPYRCGSVSVGFAGAGRWRSRSVMRCGGLYERSRAGAGVRAHTGAGVRGCGCAHGRVYACVYVCAFVLCFTDSSVLSESVNNQTNFHELTTNPRTIKQSLTASQQQRTTKQSLTDSTGLLRRQHKSTG